MPEVDAATHGARSLVKTSCLAMYISRIREPQQQPKADLLCLLRCGCDRTSINKRAVLRARQMIYMRKLVTAIMMPPSSSHFGSAKYVEISHITIA
uniref:Uncharacterized protein n=1 Tax=Trichogramma kaykai TaxID=54128 RepID=A0ABD2XDA3_9HYME